MGADYPPAEAADGGEEVIGGFDPSEWSRSAVVGVDMALDGRSRFRRRAMGTALDLRPVEAAKKRSTRLIHDEDIGGACLCQRVRRQEDDPRPPPHAPCGAGECRGQRRWDAL